MIAGFETLSARYLKGYPCVIGGSQNKSPHGCAGFCKSAVRLIYFAVGENAVSSQWGFSVWAYELRWLVELSRTIGPVEFSR